MARHRRGSRGARQRVECEGPTGTYWLDVEDAIALIVCGAAKRLGEYKIKVSIDTAKLRGPSCGVSGAAHGLAGKIVGLNPDQSLKIAPKLSYLERLLEHPLELAKIGSIQFQPIMDNRIYV